MWRSYLSVKKALWVLLPMVGIFSLVFAWIAMDAYVDPERAGASARNGLVRTFVGVLGGAAVGISAVVAWRNYQVSQHRLDLDRISHTTEAFARSVEQLGTLTGDGTPNLEVRLGAIYGLGRIADDWHARGDFRNYSSTIEVLAAYVRSHAGSGLDTWDGEQGHRVLREDVRAAISVLERRTGIPSEMAHGNRLDLRRVNFRGAELTYTRLPFSDFELADLRDCELEFTDISNSEFSRADLSNSLLCNADLTESKFLLAKLVNVDLSYANCQRVRFWSTDLTNAAFPEAILTEASFNHARVGGTDLRKTKGLTLGQIRTTLQSELVLLPKDLAGIDDGF